MELSDDFYIPTNEFQTEITKEFMESMPDEVQQWFLEFIENVEFIKRLISPDRKRAKDCPKDDEGKIIVDITNPHILEDMDYFRPMALYYKEHNCYTYLRPNPNPNSEYRKLFDEEKRRCREGYIRESDGEWVTGYLYWYLNYCPIMLTRIEKGTNRASRVEDFPDMWEGIYWRFHYLDQARNEGEHAIELARRGAHPYNQVVYTPDGVKKWEDITIGSRLFDTKGGICNVVDIPYDKQSNYYKITLRDKREVYATEDHLWKVIYKNKERTVDTKWLLQHYKCNRTPSDRIGNFECVVGIPRNEGVEFDKQSTKVDPYTFGVLLGDGCFITQSCTFTQAREDFEVISQHIPYNITAWSDGYTYKISINNWLFILDSYNLRGVKSEDKFIPEEYKFNTREVRLNVLRGLLDTDGHVHGGVPVLTTTSYKLKEDVLFIARSLGYHCFWSKQKAGYKKEGNYVECKDVYLISIYAGPEIFRLLRKQEKVEYVGSNAQSRRDKVIITNIELIGQMPCKCVTVDSIDQCYLIGDFITTHNCSKSFSLASIMAKNLILGESEKANKRVMTVLTAYQKEYLGGKDGTLSKFEPMIDFVADNTEFPRLRLTSSMNDMTWTMGYKDEFGRKKGSLNSVIGVSSKDDESKLRGKRGYILFEEMGSFPNLISIYNTVRYGMEEGDYTFGLAYLVGTAAEDASDFSSAKELLYSSEGYHIYNVENVYDKYGQGKKRFGYFFPSYVNRKGCMNKDGVSDVVKALKQILMNRYNAKYRSADPNTVIRVIAEMPITPAEAIIKVKSTSFPVQALTERLLQLDSDPKAYDDVYVGSLVQDDKGNVVFRANNDSPIRTYPLKDNTSKGAIEIFEMPQKNHNGKIYDNRYILGHDPVDNDQADSTSLSSTFVLDLFTDRIVAEYTGRQSFADENYEIVRLLCLFYNGRCLYESNKKGIYSYFAKMSCLHLLADTPEYLRDKQLVKYSSFGSNVKGVNASAAINLYANERIKDWLLKPIPTIVQEDEEDKQVMIPNLYRIRNRALLQELIAFTPEINVDRVRSLGMVMLYREEKMILYNGSISQDKFDKADASDLSNDDFFKRNYDYRY